MANAINTDDWTHVGESSNTQYYAVDDNLLAAVPHDGSVDTEETARENVAFQNDHFRKAGHGGVVIVFFDRMVSQDTKARRIYQSHPEPGVMLGTALVGGTLLSRAMGSFFLGLAKTEIPVKMFKDLDGARAWAEGLLRAAGVI